MPVSDELRSQRNANEPKEKYCGKCGELKPASQFRPLPIGGRSNNCYPCISEKTKEEDKRVTASDATIQTELWKQYDRAHNTSERIRCLEALVKLRPQSSKSDLDDPAVIAAMIKSLKKKKTDGE